MTSRFDVIVLGAGPAGLSTAIALARVGYTVGVFERAALGQIKVGETIGADVSRIFKRLGVWDEFNALGSVPFRGSKSAWGTPDLAERLSIVHPLGDGWHVDRARFEGMLLAIARGLGIEVNERCGSSKIDPAEEGWNVTSKGGKVTARFIVDASGRGGGSDTFAWGDRVWTSFDRTVGVVGWVSPVEGAPPEPELLVETVREGWWYSAPQPNGSLVLTLITDSDLIEAEGRAGLKEWWLAALSKSAHTAERALRANLVSELLVRRADSGWLQPSHGQKWVAVGDAAMAWDPLAGNGIARSLNSGLDAAEHIDHALCGSKVRDPLDPSHSFEAYLERRAEYYRMERRWPEALFWMRRQPIDWKSAPVALHPETLLQWDGRLRTRETLAPFEALLPHRWIRFVLGSLKEPLPAHQVMAQIRNLVPLNDMRILGGIQMLVAQDVLTASR